MSTDEVGNEEADIVWRYSTLFNVNSQLNKQVTFSLKDETVFFVVLLFFILLGCKYVFWICITVFVFKLINLFNAYLLLFLRILISFY